MGGGFGRGGEVSVSARLKNTTGCKIIWRKVVFILFFKKAIEKKPTTPLNASTAQRSDRTPRRGTRRWGTDQGLARHGSRGCSGQCPCPGRPATPGAQRSMRLAGQGLWPGVCARCGARVACILVPQLVPKLVPKLAKIGTGIGPGIGTIFGTKTGQNWYQIRCQNWYQNWPKLVPKFGPKLVPDPVPKWIRNVPFLERTVGLSWCQLRGVFFYN